MGAMHWRDHDMKALDAHSEQVLVAGRIVGGLVTLGHAVVFYSSDPTVAELDGRRFATAAAARQAVAMAIAANPDETTAA